MLNQKRFVANVHNPQERLAHGVKNLD